MNNHTYFLDKLFEKLSGIRVDVANYELDHIGYQSSSRKDYEILRDKFLKIGVLISEEIVGERRVSIYELNEPIVYKHYKIPALELVEPKPDQICKSSLEHVEFVINCSFEELIDRYPTLDWDKSKIDQPKFPMLKLKLDDESQVKFHLNNVLDIVKNG